jgi:hypothetical protein
MACYDEIDSVWKTHETYSVKNAASLMAGINPYFVVYNHPQVHFRSSESGTTDAKGIDKVYAHFEMLQKAIKNKKLNASIVYSARSCRGDDDKPGTDEEIAFKYEWFDSNKDDIGRHDIIYGTVPDWSKTEVSRTDIEKWLKNIGYNDMFFNPGSGVIADNRAFMNPDHLRYNPLLAAAVTAWEAFETEEVQSEYRSTNSRKSIEAWLENNAGKMVVYQSN